MRFSMTIPCDNCPFRKDGGIPLHKGRIREIAGMMLDSQGGMFPCHKTVDHDADEPEDEDDGFRIPGPNEIHCAGALAFAEKNGTATQAMRIEERLGGYDHEKVKPSWPLVWDSMREWLKGGSTR